MAIFALILQGSQRNSKEKFIKVIELVKNVRDAWRQVAKDPAANPTPVQVPIAVTPSGTASFENPNAGSAVHAWNA